MLAFEVLYAKSLIAQLTLFTFLVLTIAMSRVQIFFPRYNNNNNNNKTFVLSKARKIIIKMQILPKTH